MIFTPFKTTKNYFIKIAYDGALFGGWQIQPNAPTIQQKLQEVFSLLLKTPIEVIGQGRTDAGVHALGQTAHFRCPGIIDPFRFLRGANALLPAAIRVLEIKEVPHQFHARFSARGKIYHYYVTTAQVILPFDRPYRWHLMGPFDLDRVRCGAVHFLGTHDFTSFSNEAHRGSCKNDPLKTVKRVDIIEEPGGFRVEIEADGFLYKMCRNIVGVLAGCGKHRMEVEEIPALFALKDRRRADVAAPPHGLFLVHVDYHLGDMTFSAEAV